MSGYHAVESLVLVFAVIASAVYATAHLAPGHVARWRREALLWLIAERRVPVLRKFGRYLARGARSAQASTACGPCKGCSNGKTTA
jgi:hypothetical protein